ncbi:serine-threonine protein kinase [Nocardia sp. NBC_00403]|uniref:serine-threonine protein kinase n=1 Tax=Nocardia sp. NBC_00403 TaxID=2975990 RepID=UPI002E1FE6AF
MTKDIGGLPLLELRIDENGDVDPDGERALAAELDTIEPTDLLVFTHGWNNTPSVASRLYEAFYAQLPPLLAAHGLPDRKILLLGVFWPSSRWSDEPIPDFEPAVAVDLGGGGGAAGLGDGLEFPPPAPPNADMQAMIRAAFPDQQRAAVDELLGLLVERPDDGAALQRARDLIQTIAAATTGDGDGEQADEPPFIAQPDPGAELFSRFATQLEDLGIVTGGAGGAAGFGDTFGRLWHGAQEAARQLTYFQMKHRAGTIGERGLGPLLGRLIARRPALRIDLIGHSFGARVVSYALAGLPANSTVRSVTLLQGAFSHFAFAASLPFDARRSGALNGKDARVEGPVTACYSEHDSAVGALYPLASLLGREEAAGFDDATYRWGGIGHDGHQPDVAVTALLDVGTRYDFDGARLVNIDAARVVKKGSPPSGAHSDIIHPELAWVVASAGGLVG